MQLWVTLGLVGVLAAIGIFLMYYVSSALNLEDVEKIDPIPPQDECDPKG